MTYPNVELQRFLHDHFVFARIDLSERDDSLRDLFREVKPFWSPLFRATTAKGAELRRWFGFFLPADLILELEIVLAHDLMIRREAEEAHHRLSLALETYPTSPGAAEAYFWLGVAAFKTGDGDFDGLEQVWGELTERWPDSTWARRADVMDMRARTSR